MKKQERPTEEGRTPQPETPANERPEPHHHPAGEAAVPQQDVAADRTASEGCAAEAHIPEVTAPKNTISEESTPGSTAPEAGAPEGSADHTAAAAVRFSGLRERLAARRQALLRRIEYRRLKRIRKRTVPAYTHCKNCGERLQGMYCSRCGQYALDIEQPFWKYIRQYFENVYQFDSKVWQTLWLLFRRPGLLTCEFNAGKINSYVHPFRLYMFISVVFFTLFFMFASDIARRSVREIALQPQHLPDTVLTQLRSGAPQPDTCVFLYDGTGFAEMLELKEIPTEELLQVKSPFGGRHGLTMTHLPRLLLDSCLYRTTLKERDLENLTAARQTIARYNPAAGLQDFSGLDDEDADRLEALDLEEYDEELLALLRTFDPQRTPVYDWRQKQSDPDQLEQQWQQESFVNNLLADLSKWTPLYMMFLLPLFALLLKWAYHKRRMNFMQHFVHAIHINSFFLLLVAVPAAILIYYAEAQENNDAILISFELFFALVFLYMLLSSHTVYREGWFKTLVKSLLVFGSFTFVALCIAFVLIIRLIYTYWE